MERLAVEGFGDPSLRSYAPFVHKTKAEIVEIGTSLNLEPVALETPDRIQRELDLSFHVQEGGVRV
jgi:hypothetical protein